MVLIATFYCTTKCDGRKGGQKYVRTRVNSKINKALLSEAIYAFWDFKKEKNFVCNSYEIFNSEADIKSQ